MSSVYRYRLGNRQRKDLFVRGTPLRLVLPLPPRRPYDLKAWIRRTVEGIESCTVLAVEEQVVRVAPSFNPGERETVTSLLGAIIVEEDADVYTVGVACVSCILVSGEDVRHPPTPWQWPAFLLVDGREFFLLTRKSV